MALPSVQDCKDYLRIQHTAEDTMLTTWLLIAQARVEAALGRPIALVSDQTWTDDVENRTLYNCHPTRRLVIPAQYSPIDPATLVIADVDANVLDPLVDYYAPVTGWEGVVTARPGITFANGPYAFVADVGLETAADYATRIEPVVSAAILDVVADWYQRRNPNAGSESTGGGVSTTYVKWGMPDRAVEAVQQWAVMRV